MQRGYVASRWGQLHYRQLHFRQSGSGPRPPLLCQHAAACSGMPQAGVLEQPTLRGAIFDLGAGRLAQVMLGFLDAADAD